MAKLRKKTILGNANGGADVNGTFVVPRGVKKLWIFGHGPAGGGGGGGGGGVVSGGSACGGGGGGAGESGSEWFDVVPGETLTYTVGAGGIAGIAGVINIAGGNGGFPSNTSVSGSLFSRLWSGGVPGLGGLRSADAAVVGNGYGGGRNYGFGDRDAPAYPTGDRLVIPSYGGTGIVFAEQALRGFAANGGMSAMCPARVRSASAGLGGFEASSSSGGYLPGGRGGGGGFGEWPDSLSVPGAGGAGGGANGAGANTAPATSGTAGGQCHGGGGGGGGGTSNTNTSNCQGGAGGPGGGGALIFAWVE